VLVHDLPAHLVARHTRQVAVEHHHVIAGHGQVIQGGVAVEDHVDRHALTAQTNPNSTSQNLEILDHQHPHKPHHATAQVSERCRPKAP
jgi:hypothetical protein